MAIWIRQSKRGYWYTILVQLVELLSFRNSLIWFNMKTVQQKTRFLKDWSSCIWKIASSSPLIIILSECCVHFHENRWNRNRKILNYIILTIFWLYLVCFQMDANRIVCIMFVLAVLCSQHLVQFDVYHVHLSYSISYFYNTTLTLCIQLSVTSIQFSGLLMRNTVLLNIQLNNGSTKELKYNVAE